jgi:hypothetical protein
MRELHAHAIAAARNLRYSLWLLVQASYKYAGRAASAVCTALRLSCTSTCAYAAACRLHMVGWLWVHLSCSILTSPDTTNLQNQAIHTCSCCK